MNCEMTSKTSSFICIAVVINASRIQYDDQIPLAAVFNACIFFFGFLIKRINEIIAAFSARAKIN